MQDFPAEMECVLELILHNRVSTPDMVDQVQVKIVEIVDLILIIQDRIRVRLIEISYTAWSKSGGDPRRAGIPL